MNRILFLACLSLLISCGESKQERIEYLESQVNKLESQVYELETEIEELKYTVEDYESKFDNIATESSEAEYYLSRAKSWEMMSDDWDITVTSNISNAEMCISNIASYASY